MAKILMIDDDMKLVALVRDYLEPHGFELVAAHDGPAGLEMFRESAAKMIILDLMLPGLDGLEVCRQIRAKSDVPIVMLTARGEETDRIVGLELGADDYLPKPFNPRELLARIKAILRRASSSSGKEERRPTLSAGAVTLCPSTRRVTVGNREVELTTAEFDLLQVLMASAGRVLSRDQLMQQLHGTNWSYYDRSIDVHVSRIRQKIEGDPRKPKLLKTIRGVGYQLIRPESEA